MGMRALVDTCACTGKVSATCLRPAARWVFGPSVGGGIFRLCESEGVQGTCVTAARMGISVETGVGGPGAPLSFDGDSRMKNEVSGSRWRCLGGKPPHEEPPANGTLSLAVILFLW